MIYEQRKTDGTGISEAELKTALSAAIAGRKLKKVLLLPPDYTRMYSYAGEITRLLYDMLTPDCRVDIMPALGTHEPMSETECRAFFGDKIKHGDLLVHNWRTDVEKIGEVPAEFVSEVSENLVNEKIDVEVNRRLLDKSYDLILSIGQVVPHEVVGMANYSKNIFVGCGGSSMINSSHMLGAFYGMERVMGRDFSPVRRVFDYAQEHFIKQLPLVYILTVTTNSGDKTTLHGIYIGGRDAFEEAVAQSREKNLIFLDKPIQKAVVYLDPLEFKSTWLGNKAIYRTRMAMANGGELLILAPGVKKFGEDVQNDALIRKYGYVGRESVLGLVRENADLRENLSVAAHLIHGSSDGRFRITYATRLLTKSEVEGVSFGYTEYDAAAEKYNPEKLKPGINTVCGEEIFYIPNPALGLWSLK